MEKSFIVCVVIIGLFIFSGCTNSTTAGIPAVEYFNAASYTGTWYEIARMPNWFERGLYNVRASYTLNPDGTLKVVNSGMRCGKLKSVTGKAWFTVRPEVGELKVQFFFPFSSVYKIIYVNNDYSIAVVTGSDYSLLWILARTPQIPQGELIKLIQYVTALGYESENLVFTKQKYRKSVE